MEDSIIAQVILQSEDESSIIGDEGGITSENVDSYRIDKEVIDKVKKIFMEYGFDIVQASEAIITISGAKERFEKVFETTLQPQDKEDDTSGGLSYEAETPLRIPEELSPFVEDISFPTPPELY